MPPATAGPYSSNTWWISPVPAVTFHATQPWSLAHWDDDTELLRTGLLERAASWLGEARVLEAQVKKWRFAAPVEPWPDPCWVDDELVDPNEGGFYGGWITPDIAGPFKGAPGTWGW